MSRAGEPRQKYADAYDMLEKKSALDIKTGCRIWVAWVNKFGYGSLGENYRKQYNVSRPHQLSYLLYVGKYNKNIYQINHKCNNASCINPDHLYAGTAKDNTQDMLVSGRDNFARGSRSGSSKLTENDVLEIRQRLSNGEIAKMICKEFGVSSGTISSIRTRRLWRHI